MYQIIDIKIQPSNISKEKEQNNNEAIERSFPIPRKPNSESVDKCLRDIVNLYKGIKINNNTLNDDQKCPNDTDMMDAILIVIDDQDFLRKSLEIISRLLH